MNSFRFNFSGIKENSCDESKQDIQWLESEEVVPGNQIEKLDDLVTQAKMFTCDEIEIGHVVASNVLTSTEQNSIKNVVELAEMEHSDLVTGKYEGGLKIWECTNDLIQYMMENHDSINLNEASVLDLGCGAGIVGIYAFMNGANVTFQDYNKEVLEHITIPNVLLNIDEEERDNEIRKCKFYSGDWDSFNKLLADSKMYDYIFTSETIYNDNNYDKLISLFMRRLSQNGTIYVAAKTCYFGVGGGTRQFEQKILKNGSLKSEICWKSVGGIQREILKITIK